MIINASRVHGRGPGRKRATAGEGINADAPGRLADAAAQVGAAFIHYSTDYVFDGRKGSAYTEDDPQTRSESTAPANSKGSGP